MRSTSPLVPSVWPMLLRTVALALLTIAAVYVVLQASLPTDLELFQAQPEFSLQYPGSVVLREGGHEPAFMAPTRDTWRELGTDADPDEVLAFYRRELRERGWGTGGDYDLRPSSQETKACGWHTADLILRVGIWDTAKYVKVHPEAARYATIYELSLSDDGTSYTFPECSPQD
jgi:hypothetical protein